MKYSLLILIAFFLISAGSHRPDPGIDISFPPDADPVRVGKLLTKNLLNQIISNIFFNAPEGYINNEDCGQMSAWYIFPSLGFYPVCPGDKKYYIGAPLHPKASIQLENGNKFVIEAKNCSPENIYVQSLALNGKPLNVRYIEHETIINGGKLVFEMGSKPNKSINR
ncbi:glycoside hydrolase domain-containing protein [Bacteroidota bacterium]